MSKVIPERKKTYMPEKHTFLKCFLGFVNVKSHARKKPLLAGYRSNVCRTESGAKQRYPTP